jgi:S-adenosylmethionine:tRNA ribosyltransferase-isomerase
MRTCDYDYALPPERIAQQPLPERDASRMMVIRRAQRRWEHRTFRDLSALLHDGDLLVLNDTRVQPARLFGRRVDTGGTVDVLLVERVDRSPVPAETWDTLMRSGFVPRPGIGIELADGRLRGEIVEVFEGGRVRVALTGTGPVNDILAAVGTVPLPPYIRRARQGSRAGADRERYQTVYARHPGAVAAPTAGLHFTRAMFDALAARGVEAARLTLHVGPGTFQPVRTEQVALHRMEAERFNVPDATREAVRAARARGGRVLAVGSTAVRALESAFCPAMPCAAGQDDRTALFIYPPYMFRAVDAMLTNFHLPRSTLLMMVSAFAAPGETDAGRELILAAYADAVRERYRFYSYGDCMLLL